MHSNRFGKLYINVKWRLVPFRDMVWSLRAKEINHDPYEKNNKSVGVPVSCCGCFLLRVSQAGI